MKAKDVEWVYTFLTISQPALEFPSFFLRANLLDHDFSHSLANPPNSLSPSTFLQANFTNPCPVFCPRTCHLLLHKVRWVHSAPVPPHRVTTCSLPWGNSSSSYPFICLWFTAYSGLQASSKFSSQHSCSKSSTTLMSASGLSHRLNGPSGSPEISF